MSYPSVSFNRDGTCVKASVRIDLPTGMRTTFIFTCNLGNESYASLTTGHLCEKLSDQLHAIKQAAYNKGWKDAKSRRRKQTEFCADLDAREESL